MADSWFLYIIETEKGRLYTGITTDLSRRYQQHETGKGAKFFRTDKPQQLIYSEPHPDRASASRAEYRVKQLSRAQKLQLVRAVPRQS